MKRESSAERALKAQIKILQEKLTTLTEARDELETKMDVVKEMVYQFQSEVEKSKAMRLGAKP